jgi:hypothetical protein
MGTGVTHTVLDRTSGIPLGHGDFHIFHVFPFYSTMHGWLKIAYGLALEGLTAGRPHGPHV